MSLLDDNLSADGAMGTLVLGGSTRLVEPVTPEDMVTLMDYLQTHAPRQELSELLAGVEKLPKAVQEGVIREAMRRVAEKPLADADARRLMREPRHMAFFTWLLLRKRHRELTHEQVTAWLSGEDSDAEVERVNRELYAAAGMERLQKKILGGTGPGPSSPGADRTGPASTARP